MHQSQTVGLLYLTLGNFTEVFEAVSYVPWVALLLQCPVRFVSADPLQEAKPQVLGSDFWWDPLAPL